MKLKLVQNYMPLPKCDFNKAGHLAGLIADGPVTGHQKDITDVREALRGQSKSLDIGELLAKCSVNGIHQPVVVAAAHEIHDYRAAVLQLLAGKAEESAGD